MKKSQRARLATLTASAARTAEEAAEFTFLTTLATLQPDAAKDTDDVSPAGAANVVPPPAAAASPAAGANAPPTLASTIKGAFASLGNKVQLGTDLATRTTERDQSRNDLTARTTERDQARSETIALTATIATFAAYMGLKPTDLAGKDAAALNTLFAQKISDSAIETLATACVPAAQLPKVTPTVTSGAQSKTLTFAEFSAMSPSDKMTFSANGGRISD